MDISITLYLFGRSSLEWIVIVSKTLTFFKMYLASAYSTSWPEKYSSLQVLSCNERHCRTNIRSTKFPWSSFISLMVSCSWRSSTFWRLEHYLSIWNNKLQLQFIEESSKFVKLWKVEIPSCPDTPYLFLRSNVPHYEGLSMESGKKCYANLLWSTCLRLNFHALYR